jgi:hypothetical protein
MNHTSMKRLTLIVARATVSLWTLVALGTIAGAQSATTPDTTYVLRFRAGQPYFLFRRPTLPLSPPVMPS